MIHIEVFLFVEKVLDIGSDSHLGAAYAVTVTQTSFQ